MLALMRKHAKNWIMKVILGIIIVVFVFYFGAVGDEREAKTLATLDGKALVYENFQNEFRAIIDFYRQRLGPNFTEDMIKELNLKQQAFDNMIYKAVALHKAAELNLTFTDEEVREAILQYPGFQVKGVFDHRVYEQTLRMNRMTAEEFELTRRDILTINRLESLLASAAWASETEVKELFQLENEWVNLNIIRLSAKDYLKKVSLTTEALEEYLKKNGHLFRVPEHYQVKYLAFLGKDFEDQVKLSPEEINDVLERLKERRKKEDSGAKGGGRKQEISRERIAAELKRSKAMDLAQAAAQKAYETIYQEENFEDYASKHNIQIRTTEYFPVNRAPSFLANLENLQQIIPVMKKDEISRLLSDDQGFYILKLTGKKPSYIPKLAEVEKEVGRRYAEEQANLLCKKAAEDLLDRLKKGGDIRKIAAETGNNVMETGFFRTGGPIPKIGPAGREINEAVFLLTLKKPYPDQVFPVEGGFILFQLKERKIQNDANFEENKEQAINIVERMKKEEKVRSWIDDYKNFLIKEKRLVIKKEAKDI